VILFRIFQQTVLCKVSVSFHRFRGLNYTTREQEGEVHKVYFSVFVVVWWVCVLNFSVVAYRGQ